MRYEYRIVDCQVSGHQVRSSQKKMIDGWLKFEMDEEEEEEEMFMLGDVNVKYNTSCTRVSF